MHSMHESLLAGETSEIGTSALTTDEITRPINVCHYALFICGFQVRSGIVVLLILSFTYIRYTYQEDF